jgi:uncharacterized protein (TIGR02453 family)
MCRLFYYALANTKQLHIYFIIMKNILQFLTELDQNNNSVWFHSHKNEYQQARADFIIFCERVLAELSQLYPNFAFLKPKDCIFRINRDVRFSNNKAPYKNNFGAYFAEGGKKSAKQGFYLHLQPANQSFLGGGAYDTTPQQLYKLRQEISYEPQKFRAVFDNPIFKQHFPQLLGHQLKTAPKGYEREHPQIDLLRHTQLYVAHNYTDEQVSEVDFLTNLIPHCQILSPFLALLDEAFLF